MLQKTTWMRYLIIGFSILLISTLSSCNKEYIVNTKWVFVNQTNKTITIGPNTLYNNVFKIDPFGTYVYEERIEGATNKATTKDFGCPFNPSVFIYDNFYCDTFNRDISFYKPSSFKSRKINKYLFEFVYTFTPDLFLKSVPCK